MKQIKQFFRRRMALLLAVVMVISMLPIGTLAVETPQEEKTETVAAEGVVTPMALYTTEDGLQYYNNGSYIKITDYFGSATELVIPDHIDGVPVTTIGWDAFDDCDDLVSVTLPESVTVIEGSAFSYCCSLADIGPTEQLVEIGYGAFYCCESLTSFDLPDSLRELEKNVFSYCSSLRNIDLPNGLKSIGDGAFAGCSSLSGIAIPSSVTSIGAAAFRGCAGFTGIDLPSNLVSLGEYAFAECTSLTSIELPDTLTSIGASTFSGCNALTSIELPDELISIGASAFSGCRALASIELPDTLISIGYYAFANCSTLASIVLPETATDLGYTVFYKCTSLRSIDLPDGLKVLPDSFFSGCTSLADVTLPANLQTIGWSVFSNCISLTNIDLPNSLTSIGEYAFCGCDSLSAVHIPAAVTDIGSTAFLDCKRLSTITVSGQNGVYSVNDGMLYKNSDTMLVFCPMTRSGSVEILDTATSIGQYAFYDCNKLTAIEIPDSVTSIGSYAFYNCDGLNSLTIPDSVISTGISVCADCDNLTSLEWSSASKYIPWYAFESCDNLTALTIPNSVTTITYEATLNCNNLSDVYYDGTRNEWSLVSIGVRNTGIENATIHFNDGTTSKDEPGEDNEPLVVEWGKATFSYYSMVTEEIASYYFNYDENWFFEDSTTYNHELAQMSIRMAMAGGTTKGECIDELLRTLRFSDIKSVEETYPYPTAKADSIGYAIGSKTIRDADETITLIAVVVRSAGYESEWASNVMVGLSSDHYGFDQSAAVVANAIEQYIDEIGVNSNIKVWISGFSRGAAVSNIVAARLNTSVAAGYIPGLTTDGIFAYCFATPQSVTDESGKYKTNYKNIFNIVNPIDLVPMVAPSGWDFNRCGITYYLPSSEMNNSGYTKSYGNMVNRYINILHAANCESASTDAYDLTENIAFQHSTFSGFVDLISFGIGSQSNYYITFQDDLAELMASMNGKDANLGTRIVAAAELFVKQPICWTLIPALPVIGASVRYITHAHYPELYLAWMDTVDEDFPTDENRVRYLKANCPVDIAVYDTEGNLVTQIIDDVVQEIEGSTIEAIVDLNGQKVVALPADAEFQIEISATGTGTMSYQIEEYDLDQGGTVRILNYYDIEIATGDTLKGTASLWEDDISAEYTLVDSEGNAISSTNEFAEDELCSYGVTVSAEGNGTVGGGGPFFVGEYSKITAEPDDGYEFLGWYVEDKLISKESEYRFRVEGNADIVGKFAVLGDVNDDGVVDIFDLVRLQNYLADDSVAVNTDAADVNEDGVVDIFDLVRLQNMLANAG